VSSYQSSLGALDLSLLAARTVATTVLVLVGLYLVLTLEDTAGRLYGCRGYARWMVRRRTAP
jgi:hypothetical protein